MTNYLVFYDTETISYQHGYDLPCDENLIVPPRTHPDLYEILYVNKGNIHHSVDGENFEVCGGDLLLINIGATHNLNVDLTSEYERFALHFNPALIGKGNEFLFSPFIREDGHKSAVYPAETVLQTEIPNIFYKMDRALNGEIQTEKPELLLSAYIIELLYEIYGLNKTAAQKLPVKINALTKKTIDLIATRIYEPLTVEEIADALFINKFYLSHSFKKNIGVPLKDYIIRQKMDLARRLIKNENMPSTSVAERIGYKNYNVFYKSYVKTYGESPSGKKSLSATASKHI